MKTREISGKHPTQIKYDITKYVTNIACKTFSNVLHTNVLHTNVLHINVLHATLSDI